MANQNPRLPIYNNTQPAPTLPCDYVSVRRLPDSALEGMQVNSSITISVALEIATYKRLQVWVDSHPRRRGIKFRVTPHGTGGARITRVR